MTYLRPASAPNELFEALFKTSPTPYNEDFHIRAVNFPEDENWIDSAMANIQVRILEFIPGQPERLTALVRLLGPLPKENLPAHGLELLMLNGLLKGELGSFGAGSYVRNPVNDGRLERSFCLGAEESAASDDQQYVAAQCYVSMGQVDHSDTRVRRIDTQDEKLWLPGPVDGTDVLPLHLHNTSNAMLIRWNEETAFRPKLDPLGEEILVLNGKLFDRHGEYSTSTWIRNPVEEWQSWAGGPGTVVYYKNGHFKN